MLQFLRIETVPLDSPGPSKYHLGTFLAMIKDEDHFTFLGSLLRMQGKAMGEFFFEKLKGNASVEWARQKLSKLSPTVCTSRFDEWKLWLLACFFLHLCGQIWDHQSESESVEKSQVRVKVTRSVGAPKNTWT